MAHKMQKSIYQMIEELAGVEKITRKVLGKLSRNLLVYVPESNDIDAVNRLMGILTPANATLCQKFFRNFLPWKVEKNKDGSFSRFGKRMTGEKSVQEKLDATLVFLATRSNTIWTWHKEAEELKQKNFQGMIAKAIENALEGHEKTHTPALSRQKIMEAVFQGGIGLADMLEAVETYEAKVGQAEEQHLAA